MLSLNSRWIVVFEPPTNDVDGEPFRFGIRFSTSYKLQKLSFKQIVNPIHDVEASTCNEEQGQGADAQHVHVVTHA